MKKATVLSPSMLVKWNKSDEQNIRRNVEALMELLVIDDTGNVTTTKRFLLDAHLHILSHYTILPKIESHEIKKDLIRRAAFIRLKKYKAQKLGHFRIALAAEVRKFLNSSPVMYHIVFPLHGNFAEDKLPASAVLLGKTIEILTWDKLESNYDLKLFFMASKSKFHPDELRHKFVPSLIKESGRKPDEAFDKADEVFDLLRCVLNLYSGFGRYQMQWGESKPLAESLPAPVFGMFDADGTYVDLYYNSERPDYYPEFAVTPHRFAQTKSLIKDLFLSETSNELQQLVIEAMRKYGSAIDSAEWRLSFLELWQVLELLTLQTNKQLNMKHVLNRINVLLNHDSLIKDLLNMLYRDRNLLVHEGQFPYRRGIEKVGLLKHIVEQSFNAIFEISQELDSEADLENFYTMMSLGNKDLASKERAILYIKERRSSGG